MKQISPDVILECPLFSFLKKDEVEELIPLFSAETRRIGDVVFRAGDPGDALYLIARGRLRVIGNAADGTTEVNLATLTAGKHFGELALVSGEPRSATVRVAEDCRLWRLGRAEFEALVARHPGIKSYLEHFIENVAVRAFFKKWTAFSQMSPQSLRELLEAMKVRKVDPGAFIFREGEKATDFYVVRTGTFRIVRAQPGETSEKVLGTAGPGDHFGELAIMTQQPRAASVKAVEGGEVYALTAAKFRKLLGADHEIRRRMQDQIKEYQDQSRKDAPMVVTRSPSEAAGPGRERTAPPPPPTPPVYERRTTGPLPPRGAGRAHRSARNLFGHPILSQAEELDCAASCLAMVSRYYGARSAMAPLRDLTNITKDGATLLSIAQAAEQVGFDVWVEDFTWTKLQSVELPAIVLWEGYHWVVVYEIAGGKVVLGDPAIGIRKLDRETFEQGFSGQTLVLVPAGKIRRLAGAGIGLEYFTPLIRPYGSILRDVLLCALLITLFGLSVPIFTSTVVDAVVVRGSTSMLNVMLLGMLFITTFQLISQGLQTYLMLFAANRIDLGLVLKFYRHVLRLPTRYFDVRKVGDILARFEENEEVRELFTGTPLQIVLSLFTVALYLTLMSFFNLQLTLTLLAYVPLFALLTWTATPIMRRLSQEAFARTTQARAFLIESINGIQTVKALAIAQPVRWRWQNTFIDGAKRSMKREMADGALETGSEFIQKLSTVTLLFFGAQQVMEGKLTVGQLMAFYTMIGMIMGPITQLLDIWDDLQSGTLALERISEVLAFPQEQPEEERAQLKKMPALKGHVKFEDVYFSYDPKGGKRHLDGVTFEALPGEMIAAVGRSGAGKSTLASLILAMRQPQAGRILIDGIDLKDIDVRSLRRQIGVVLQDNFLFSGTIRENIDPDDPGAPMERIVRAATLAGAHDFISQLPQGYDTVIGERGSSLSGGQRQRVAIARCLYRDPRIILFDEATSALDTESERIIQENMGKILRGRTSIVIAHRLSTIRAADKILVMDAGRIVEMGNHAQLMELRGLYHMLNTQSVRED